MSTTARSSRAGVHARATSCARRRRTPRGPSLRKRGVNVRMKPMRCIAGLPTNSTIRVLVTRRGGRRKGRRGRRGNAQEALQRARELVARVLLEGVERVAEPRLAHDLQRAAVRPLQDVHLFRAALQLRGDRVSELIGGSEHCRCTEGGVSTLWMTP